MADAIVEKPAEFNATEFMETRNAADKLRREGKEPPKVEAKVAEVKPPAEIEHPDTTPHLPRSVRREINKFREAAAEERGRRLALEELFGKVKPNGHAEPDVKTGDDPEPDRTNFATDAEYNRALGRWDARQEAKTELAKHDEKSEEQAADKEWDALVSSMEAKAREDSKYFPDWEAALEKAAEADDALMVKGQLWYLVKASDYQAGITYHFVKHPEELQKLNDLPDGPIKLRNFGRLESKVERLYYPDSTKPAAQAEEPKKKASEDRHHLAEAPKDAGRTAVDRDVHKPKPSAEVEARGGSAPPQEVSVETDPKAWIAKRNQAQFGR